MSLTFRSAGLTSAGVPLSTTLLVGIACALSGCGGGDDDDASTPIVLSTVSPKATCASLSGQTLPATVFKIASGAATISTAVIVPATPGALAGNVWNPAVPEYCKVNGSFASLDTSAPASNFQVNLPTAWNQRVMQLGNSGLAGSIPGALNTHRNAPESQPVDVGGPVTKGYIEVGTDGGHQSGNAWMLNAEALANYAYRTNKRAHDATWELARQYYGDIPKLSYFAGSSQGGREGLSLIQNFPEDYDGVFIQVPVTNLLSLTLRGTVLAQKQTTAATFLPASKNTLISNEVLRQCDALDGAADGVVSAYEQCNAIFVNPVSTARPWARIRCASGNDEGATCLSDGQIGTLNAMHTDIDYGYALGAGITPGYAGFGVGGEVPYGFNLETAMPTATYAGGLFSVYWKSVVTGDPNFPQMTWNPATYKDRFVAMSALLDGVDPDLSKFMARGGKLFLKTNSGDYTSNWRETVLYYKRVVAKLGQPTADSFVRFYVAPGQMHSMSNNPVQRGAYGDEIPSQVDTVDILDAWVAGKTVPPDSIMLSQKNGTAPFAVTSSRPMCKYPAYPKFVGGDRTLGTNYACTTQ